MLCQICQKRSANVHETHIMGPRGHQTRTERDLCEVFPQAGASLDQEKKLLFVEADRKLFPDPYRSLGFCALASYLLVSGLPRDDFFRFQPAKM